MFCPKCGNELPETAAFCNACGATIEKRPSATADAKSTAASINAGAKKPGAGLNPKLIGAIAVVVVIVVAFVVGIGSCSSNTGGNASTTSMSQSSVTSGGNTGGSSKTSSSVDYAGTWKDYDYGDTMELNSNGLCIINQKGKGTTYWQWEETSDGICIKSDSKTYTLSYGYVDGKETLYNNSKGLKFQR